MNKRLRMLASQMAVFATIAHLVAPAVADGRRFVCHPEGRPDDHVSAKRFAASFFPLVHAYDAKGADRFITASTFLTHADLSPADPEAPRTAADRGGVTARSQASALAVCGRLEEYHRGSSQDADRRIRLRLQGHRHQIDEPQTVYCRVAPAVGIPSQPSASLIAGRLDGREFWTIQYYMLQFFNDAPYSELYSALKDKELDHEGDWLCVQLTVEELWDGQFQLVDVTMQNHERVILAMPRLLPDRYQPIVGQSGVHPQIWLEAGCHEPYPFSGSHGLLKKPTGVYYAHLDDGDHTGGQRDYPLAHSGQQTISANEVTLVMLAEIPDPRPIGDILNRVADGDVATRLDPVFVDRYSGLYGGSDNSPQGPDWRGGRWSPGGDVVQWSYGQVPADDVHLAEWYHWILPGLDAMREYFNIFEDNWIEGVALFPAFCVVVVGTLILAVLGGISTLADMSFGDDWGGDGSGGDGGPDADGNIPPLKKGKGDGWSISQEGTTLYAQLAGKPKRRVCAVPVLTEEGESILRIKEADAVVVGDAMEPAGIRFTALGPTTPPSEEGPEFDCWLFMDGWPRACRPGKNGTDTLVLAPLAVDGARGEGGWELGVSADGREYRARRNRTTPWSRVCPVPKDLTPDPTAGISLVFAEHQTPTGVCFVLSGTDRETLYACDTDGRVSRHGFPRIFRDARTLGTDLRVEVVGDRVVVGRPQQDTTVWTRVATLPKSKAVHDVSSAQATVINGDTKVLLRIGEHYYGNISTSVLADESEFDKDGKPVLPPELLGLFTGHTAARVK